MRGIASVRAPVSFVGTTVPLYARPAPEQQDLTRRAAMISGASRGLGRAIAMRLARDGCDIAVLYHTEDALATSAVDEITALGADAFSIQVDVADGSSVDAAVKAAIDRWGHLEIVVCNAGIFSRSTLPDTTDDEFTRTFDVNVRGVFNLIRAALPVMMHQRYGRIVTVSSHNAKRGTGASSKATYAATKNAVESYTRGAAVEGAPFGITVNCVSPGWIEKGPPPLERSDFEKALLAAIPLGRPGRPDEVGAAVAFLASDDAGYITGETLDVNGGTWMD
jgi:3-oxoacyl-[acyl-carrier protein] reductase